MKWKKIGYKVITVCFWMISLNTLCFPQESAILIGLRHDIHSNISLPYFENNDHENISIYRTLWIKWIDKDSIKISQFQNIFFPDRNDTLWKIKIDRQQKENWTEDYILKAPLKGEFPGISPDPLTILKCEGNKRRHILFINSEYLSIEGGSDGFCEGAAHPFHTSFLRTLPFNNFESNGLKISKLFGQKGTTAIQQGARSYLSQMNDQTLDPDPNERNWAICRKNGNWVIRGQLDYRFEIHRGNYALFDIGLPVNSIIKYDNTNLALNNIQTRFPDARDVILSPNGEALIVFRDTKLEIYSIRNSTFFDLKKIYGIFPDEFVIMIQWIQDVKVKYFDEQINDWIHG